MKTFAILRHAKIKNGRHLVATGIHNARGADTPNADPEAPPVEILVGSNKPHRDVRDELRRRGIGKVMKGGNVAVEILLEASPEWWESKGWKPGIHPTGELAELIKDWKADQLLYLQERCGDRLVSAIYHGDEASPHVQALAVPVKWAVDGREKGEQKGRLAWRLDAEVEMGSPGVLKARQTDYAKRMARFGLVRGKDIPTIEREALGETHKPLRVWQAEQAEQGRERDRLIDGLKTAHADTTKARDDAARSAKEARRDAERAAEVLRAAEDREAALRVAERRLDADRVKAEVVKRSQALERSKLDAEKGRLAGIASDLATMLQPIRDMARDWSNAKGMRRQAMGEKGEVAAKIEEAPEISLLDAMLKRLGVTR